MGANVPSGLFILAGEWLAANKVTLIIVALEQNPLAVQPTGLHLGLPGHP